MIDKGESHTSGLSIFAYKSVKWTLIEKKFAVTVFPRCPEQYAFILNRKKKKIFFHFLGLLGALGAL